MTFRLTTKISKIGDLIPYFRGDFCHKLAVKKSCTLTCTTCTITSELYTVDILSFISAERAKRGWTSQHKVVKSKLAVFIVVEFI